MNNVKCKTKSMAVRDFCLVWGCPGLVILTISLFVSLKVGNDFGQLCKVRNLCNLQRITVDSILSVPVRIGRSAT